jgi:hypothetical protein
MALRRYEMETVCAPSEPGLGIPDNPDNPGFPENPDEPTVAASSPVVLLPASENILTSFTVQKDGGTPPDDASLLASILLETVFDFADDDLDGAASFLFTLYEDNGDLIATAEATLEHDGEIETFGPYVAELNDPWEWIIEHFDVTSV